MPEPRIPIEVDSKTGVWTTDGLPMLYMPRHFFINNHIAVENSLGRDRYATQLYTAGFKSAWAWCDHEATQHSMSGISVFDHYMQRISLRGWGQFDGSNINPETCTGDVLLRNSCFILGLNKSKKHGKVCYLFSGWFPGALAWVMGDIPGSTNLICEETQCASEGYANCVFTVKRSVRETNN